MDGLVIILFNIRKLMIANIFRSKITARLSTYAQKMKEAWDNDPALVHESWDNYFRSGPAQ